MRPLGYAMPGKAMSKALDLFKQFKAGDVAHPTPPFTLSGGTGPFQFNPSPMPEVPFMAAPQVGPQMIPRGGNLGLPTSGPFAPPALNPALGGPQTDPSSAFGQGYQSPMQLQVADAAAGGGKHAFNPGIFNLGMSLMGRAGSPIAGLGPAIAAFMARRAAK